MDLKYIMLGSIVLLLIPLLICIYIVHNVRQSALKKAVMGLLFSEIVSFMVYGFAFMTVNRTLALIFYGLFYLGIDFMTIALAIYGRVYANGLRVKKDLHIMTIVFLLVDGILVVYNLTTEKMFQVERFVDTYGNPYYGVMQRDVLFLVHVFICYVFVLHAFGALIYRIYHCPKVFRVKYRVLLISMVLAMLFNFVYIKFGGVFDYSLIGYMILSVGVTYFSFYHIPMGLVEKILALFIKSMDDGVICFDRNGNCIYANDRAKRIFHSEQSMDNLEQYFKKWLNGRSPLEAQNKKWEQIIKEDGKERDFEIEYKKLIYENREIGSFFVMHDRTEEVERVEEERYKADHDALTGLYNREYFYERAKELMQENKDTAYYIVCSDVRDFKIVNDIYGKQKGDEIIRKQAESLREKTPPGCVYGRLAGDRFAICLPKELFQESIFRKEISRIERIEGNTNFRLRIYMGIYEVDDLETPVSVMCDRAVMALKTIKDDAASRMVYYDETFLEIALREQNIVGQFQDALDSGQFCFYIQPQTSVDGTVHGGEALVRWIHPERGLIPPFEFIDLFERTGLISKLDRYIWEKACIQLRDWRRQGHVDCYLSVNISPRDFYYMDIYKTFTELIQKHGIEARNLHLEITETAVMSDMKKVIRLVNKLRQYGFKVEMDDFGSGYSSLNMLKAIHMDTIKLDMGFLRKTMHTERSMAIVRNVIHLSKKLGMEVITEGVETKEQVDALTQMGCDVFQGYYFAKPMSVWDFEDAYIPNELNAV